MAVPGKKSRVCVDHAVGQWWGEEGLRALAPHCARSWMDSLVLGASLRRLVEGRP